MGEEPRRTGAVRSHGRVLIMLVLPLALVLNVPHMHNQSDLWHYRLIGGLIVVALLIWHTWASHVRPVRKSHHTLNPIGMLPSLLPETLQQRAGAESSVSLRRAMYFAESITAPTRTFRRIVEEYEPGYRSLRKKVTLEVQIDEKYLPDGVAQPHKLDNVALVPLLVAPKSVLQDNFHITDAEGRTLSSLSYREYLELSARILRALIAHGSGSLTNLADQERAALAEIARRRNDKKRVFSLYRNETGRKRTATYNLDTPADLQRHVVSVIDGIAPTPHEGTDLDTDNAGIALHLAADFINTLAAKYAIVVPVPIPDNGRIVLHYTQTVSPIRLAASHTGWNVIRWLKGVISILLGARPVQVNIRLDLAGMCYSYHLRVQAAEGYYLASQGVDEKKYEAYFKSLAPDAPTPPHLRYRARLGQRYAHLYGRNCITPAEVEKIPVANFTFYEVQPGSDFRAAAAALSAAFLIGLIGFWLSHSTPDTSKDAISDAPLLLLAFPGVAASWLGMDNTSPRLFDSSIAARLSLLITVVSSVLASALFIINKSEIEKSAFDRSLAENVSLLGVSKAWWVGVTAVAVTNALCITYTFGIRAWTFAHLAKTSRLSDE